jgi:hypothetical protein
VFREPGHNLKEANAITWMMMSRHLLKTVLTLACLALAPTTSVLAGGLSAGDRQQVELETSRPSVELDIHFNFDTADVSQGSFSDLDLLGRALTDESLKGMTFMIAAHADAIDDPKSRDLAERRAETIKHFLVSSYRIDAGHLVTSAIPASPDHPNGVRITSISDEPSKGAAPKE